jgi:STAS domain
MTCSSIIVDCGRLEAVDLATIDRIARLGLAARRRGCRLQLRDADQALLELIGFVGLAGTLGVEPGRQTEKWKQPCRVEEEGELHDPPL